MDPYLHETVSVQNSMRMQVARGSSFALARRVESKIATPCQSMIYASLLFILLNGRLRG